MHYLLCISEPLASLAMWFLAKTSALQDMIVGRDCIAGPSDTSDFAVNQHKRANGPRSGTRTGVVDGPKTLVKCRHASASGG